MLAVFKNNTILLFFRAALQQQVVSAGVYLRGKLLFVYISKLDGKSWDQVEEDKLQLKVARVEVFLP